MSRSSKRPRARRTGFSHRVGASSHSALTLRSLPVPMPQALSRPNSRCGRIIPDDMGIPSPAFLADRAVPRASDGNLAPVVKVLALTVTVRNG
jgi:hypothetical protein